MVNSPVIFKVILSSKLQLFVNFIVILSVSPCFAVDVCGTLNSGLNVATLRVSSNGNDEPALLNAMIWM